MKWPLGFCLLALAPIAACSVDVEKLRAPTPGDPDAAADAGRDLGPDTDAGTTGLADGATSQPDEPAAAIDAADPTDDGPAGETQGGSDATDGRETGRIDAIAGDDATASLDVPPASPDLPPEDSLALPPDSADLEDSAAADMSPEASATDAAGDVEQPSDARDAGGLSNGASCSSADQCQSGFCVGVPGHCCVQSCSSACYRPNQCSTTGACMAASGTITCGDLDALCGLTVRDFANANEWSLQANLQVGVVATGSDQHTLSAVPSELRGSPWIRPSRDSKSATMNPLVTFTLSAPADVYVGIDTRVSTPSWLSSWTDSGLSISYTVYSSSGPPSTVTQRLRKARFAEGEVSLGPLGCFSTSSCSMYLTVIRFVDQETGTSTCK